MFGLFKKKSEKEVLQKQYKDLLNEAYKLSTVNRKASDDKTYEAEQVMKKIDALNED
ncbi:Lacal_2735 family protein [Cellulophaga sp. Hel_I_12]|uniref:Lacal_2735 family protein n=1 Tax=Cellulophaga sp. Hel_I_12 TaxID=1249972 RepID=UPI00064641A5|nr:Lacal_2735 family protein [Cellulophaga sp. Hel_I_12]